MFTRMVRWQSIVAALTMLSSAHALRIEVNYDYDSGGFFTDPTARMTLERAAADLGAMIGPGLSAVSTLGFTGGGRTRLEAMARFDHPSTVAPLVLLPRFLLEADEVRLYVGSRSMGGNQLAGTLPLEVSVASYLGGGAADFAAAAAEASAMLERGGGPIVGRRTIGNVLGFSDVTFGALGGTTTFNLNAAWHLDYQTLPGPGTSDLYSVALHEMLHMLGVGTSETWDAGVNPSSLTWTGPHVRALLGGSDAPLTTTGGHHFAEGTMGFLPDGTPQEVLFDPTLKLGTRKRLTTLDLALLEDIGFVVVPEPGVLALLVAAALLGLVRLSRPRSRNSALGR